MPEQNTVAPSTRSGDPGHSLPQPLISAAALLARLQQGQPIVLLDASFDLAQPQAGRQAWLQAHLPGAVYVDLETDLCGPRTGGNGRHPLPSASAFASRVAAWGISPQSAVAVYDRQGSMFAARLWWMLRWLGLQEVAVLDGGFAAWLHADGPVESGSAVVPTRPLEAGASAALHEGRGMPTIQADELMAVLDRVGVDWAIVDARAPERYRGEVEPLDRVAGHIPGALNHCFKLNLSDDGHFLPAPTLRAAFEALLGGRAPGEVIHQCGSGVTACHNLLAMEAAGLPGGVLYPGSWSEWCADAQRPIAVGSDS